VTLVTLLGGARSGKSRLAVELANATGDPVAFVATGEARDEEMTERIAAHRRSRPYGWKTIEDPYALEQAVTALPAGHVAIVDCLSLWVANVLERGTPEDEIVARAERAARAAALHGRLVVGVSNEVGLGIVPMDPLGRAYRDLLGTVNRIWVDESAEAAFVVAGRLLPLLSADDLLARSGRGTPGGD
jgi:adenosylcobinamide kinase/adenosylcobinamide-phosphate guanylyltransferase